MSVGERLVELVLAIRLWFTLSLSVQWTFPRTPLKDRDQVALSSTGHLCSEPRDDACPVSPGRAATGPAHLCLLLGSACQ